MAPDDKRYVLRVSIFINIVTMVIMSIMFIIYINKVLGAKIDLVIELLK